MKANRDFWTIRTLPPDQVCLWRLGHLRLWILREESEWAVAAEQSAGDLIDCTFVPQDVCPKNLDWKIFAFGSVFSRFYLEPTAPDRPVVFSPDKPVTLPPGQGALYFARIPAFVKLFVITEAAGKESEAPPPASVKGYEQGKTEEPPNPRTLLHTFASESLSDTWFGTAQEGELSYAARMSASRNLDDLSASPSHFVVPVELTNRSKIDLLFERLCLRLDRTALYAGQQHLWTSAVRVDYRGKEPLSQVTYLSGTPSFEPALRLLAEPATGGENLIRRSFGWLGRHTNELFHG